DVRGDEARLLVEDVAGTEPALDGLHPVVVVERRVALEALADGVRQVSAASDGGRAVLRRPAPARSDRQARRKPAQKREPKGLHAARSLARAPTRDPAPAQQCITSGA